jgi:hypothetical protein
MSKCIYAPYGKGDCGQHCDGINHHYSILETEEIKHAARMYELVQEVMNRLPAQITHHKMSMTYTIAGNPQIEGDTLDEALLNWQKAQEEK